MDVTLVVGFVYFKENGQCGGSDSVIGRSPLKDVPLEVDGVYEKLQEQLNGTGGTIVCFTTVDGERKPEYPPKLLRPISRLRY
jgi:hypothetical protein